MSETDNVLKLANYVRSLRDLAITPRNGSCHSHIGATICDAVLQAGLNYRTVVAPRIQRLLHRWPSAVKTSRFLTLIQREGLNDVLRWQHPEKPTRIGRVTDFLKAASVETECDLADWLKIDANCQRLLTIDGVGPKTVDYLKTLIGVPAIAVDRHLRAFIKSSGVDVKSYREIHDLLTATADKLAVQHQAFDHAIWRYSSESRPRAA